MDEQTTSPTQIRFPDLLILGVYDRVKRVLISAIRLYQLFISPLSPPACRFTPTCSCYAIEALNIHGFLRGSLMALARILKCHPWHRGGFDPVKQPRKN